ncbi:Oidioi.mRNA.OKI2018_I69.XSR.g16984.t1.cds [Oikopleura dioica]|uniref:Oidioi.mRNA.OKI2018_I69.XSR.g16984.t1.cds n=1 Tax=Oikopleura dioica TaxID=34765 RepID=A0ABN7SIB5_OIKDI|nr:Oidioi.mRNA.OKI2018_I69.XSR.g16984.t1.cds [Oikopleura dioica]
MSRPKKRKLGVSFIPCENQTFSDWLVEFKVDHPYAPDSFEKELDSENNWTFRLRCVGPCRNNNDPFSVKESGCQNSIKISNVKRHINGWHAPLPDDAGSRKKKVEREENERYQAAAYFKPRRKVLKPAVDKFKNSAVSLCSEQHVSFRFLESDSFHNLVRDAFSAGGGHPEDAKQLDLTYDNVKTLLFKSHVEMLDFLSKVLPILIERGCVTLECDTKYTGRTSTGDLESSAFGTLLIFYDASKDQRFKYLLQYTPITDKTDVACAAEIEETLAEYGIKTYQRLIGVTVDGGQKGVAEYVSLKAAICGAHSAVRSMDGMIQNAVLYARLDSDLSTNVDKFISHCRNGLTYQEKKKLKLGPQDCPSINNYFAKESLSDEEKIELFKRKTNTTDMTEEEIKKKSSLLKGYPQIRRDNGIRWNKKQENLQTLVSWGPKLQDLSSSTNDHAYLIPRRVAFPDLDFVTSLSIITTDLMEFVRTLEDPASKVCDQLLIFEEMLIYSTMEEHQLLKSIRQKQFHSKLRSGLFIKLMKMVFGAFYEQIDKLVDGKEPLRATDLNLACLYLTPSKYTCSFRHLQNALLQADEQVYGRNIKLIEDKTSSFMKKAKDFIWYIDKELEKYTQTDKNKAESTRKQPPQLNPNNDFKIITNSTSKLKVDDSLEAEFSRYEGQIAVEEWEEITDRIEEKSPHFIHKKLTAFWKSMSIRFPRLSKVALQIINVPGSSCDLEREFSETTRDTMDPCRNRMKNETILLLRQFKDAKIFKTAILQYCQKNNIKLEE